MLRRKRLNNDAEIIDYDCNSLFFAAQKMNLSNVRMFMAIDLRSKRNIIVKDVIDDESSINGNDSQIESNITSPSPWGEFSRAVERDDLNAITEIFWQSSIIQCAAMPMPKNVPTHDFMEIIWRTTAIRAAAKTLIRLHELGFDIPPMVFAMLASYGHRPVIDELCTNGIEFTDEVSEYIAANDYRVAMQNLIRWDVKISNRAGTIAVRHCNTALCMDLVKHGFDVGSDAVYHAVALGNTMLVYFLLAHETTVHPAVVSEIIKIADDAIVGAFIAAGYHGDDSAFEYAIERFGKTHPLVKLMLDCGWKKAI